MKKIAIICLFSFSLNACFAQSDFVFFGLGTVYQNTVKNINENSGTESISDPKTFGFVELMALETFEENFYLKGIGTGLEAMIFPASKPYSLSLLDVNFGKNFNKNRPISLGPVDIRLGMGLTAGFKFFSYKHSYLSYGITFHSMINFGENCQLLYVNTLAPGFNNRYDKIGRTAHEFYFMYEINEKVGFSLSPYKETYHYQEVDTPDLAVKNKFLGLRIGFCGVIE